MKAYADLEIGLHRRDATGYAIELRFSQPESDADVRLARGSPALVQLDLDRLRPLALDDVAYGRALGEYLLADPEIQAGFRQARSAAQALEAPLRVRLFVGPSAPELHSLRWETIRDPEDGSLWLTDERVLFSRYLSSLDWQPVRLRPQGSLRALVVIANPTNLAEYQPDGRPLAPLDVDDELARAKTSLGGLAMTALASGGAATLNALSARLRDGYDILYLVCHGTLTRGEPWLWLEDETGRVARVAGGELATRLRELQHRPSLVVLASCQSAGRGQEAAGADAGALAAIGPRLAEVGIPAVLAMQGNVTIETMSAFLPTFFQELRRDGQIDRAVAAARGAVRHRPDWWMPVLFMRLRSGRIWYVPGFPDTFDK